MRHALVGWLGLVEVVSGQQTNAFGLHKKTLDIIHHIAIPPTKTSFPNTSCRNYKFAMHIVSLDCFDISLHLPVSHSLVPKPDLMLPGSTKVLNEFITEYLENWLAQFESLVNGG